MKKNYVEELIGDMPVHRKVCYYCKKKVIPISQAMTDLDGNMHYEESCPECDGIISEGH